MRYYASLPFWLIALILMGIGVSFEITARFIAGDTVKDYP